MNEKHEMAIYQHIRAERTVRELQELLNHLSDLGADRDANSPYAPLFQATLDMQTIANRKAYKRWEALAAFERNLERTAIIELETQVDAALIAASATCYGDNRFKLARDHMRAEMDALYAKMQEKP